jgi:hypothetical protein
MRFTRNFYFTGLTLLCSSVLIMLGISVKAQSILKSSGSSYTNSLLFENSDGLLYCKPTLNSIVLPSLGAKFTINGSNYTSGPVLKLTGSSIGIDVDGISNFNGALNILGTNSAGYSLVSIGGIKVPSIIIGSPLTPGLIGTCANYLDLAVNNPANPCDMHAKAAYENRVITLFSGKAKVYGKLETNTIQITDGASIGKVLVSDRDGNGIWTGISDINIDDHDWIRNEKNGLYVIDENVGIGIIPPAESKYKLFVTGGILTEEVKVELKGGPDWPDYVFASNYKLNSLSDVEAYISKNKHLPDLPSAESVRKEGINLGEMNAILLQKVEELTLYIIQQQKQIDELRKSIKN